MNHTVEEFKTMCRESVRGTIYGLIDEVFPSSDDCDPYMDSREKMGEFADKATANVVESVFPLISDMLLVPAKLTTVNVHVEEDGISSKGGNVVAKITTPQTDENILSLFRLGGRSAMLVSLNQIQAESIEMQSGPFAQVEFPLQIMEDLYYVIDFDGERLCEDAMPLAEANTFADQVRGMSSPAQASGIRVVALTDEAIKELMDDIAKPEDNPKPRRKRATRN